MSNIREHASEARRQAFETIKTLGSVTSADLANVMNITYSIATAYTAEMYQANLLKRVRNGRVWEYSTDVAEYRWAERERSMVRAHEIDRSIAKRARKAQAKTAPQQPAPLKTIQSMLVEQKAQREAREAAELKDSWIDHHSLGVPADPVTQLVNKIQALSFRDAMRLKAALAEVFA